MSKSYNKKLRTPILKGPGVPRSASSTSQAKVKFKLPTLQLDEVFSSFTKRENTKPYEELVLTLRDADLQDEDLKQLLHCLKQCVPVLDQSLHHFVNAFLKVKWVHRSDGVVKAYQDLLVELISAHNYYIISVLEALVSCFSEGLSTEEWVGWRPTREEVACYDKVHDVLHVLVEVVPMSGEKLVQAIVRKFPYLKVTAHEQECFVYNVLCVVDQHPALAKELMELVVSRLVALDVSLPSSSQEAVEEVFQMDDQGLAHTLDVLMGVLLSYVHDKCSTDWESSKSAYLLFLHAFERAVLPTHATGYVQFFMFYLCSFRITLAEAFINFLWRSVASVVSPHVIRQAAVMYLASFLVRANYVTLNMLKSTLSEMAAWIHKYICNQDEAESINVDIRLHSVFYSVCQAMFYVVAHRHTDLVESRKNLTFLQSLGLSQIVTSTLNPLRVCQPLLVQRFAAVTCKYQLAYCYTVMERNARTTMPVIYTDEKGLVLGAVASRLEAIFPFDPLCLQHCRKLIAPLYRELKYTDMMEDIDEGSAASDQMQEDDNDFLEDMSPTTSSAEMLSVIIPS